MMHVGHGIGPHAPFDATRTPLLMAMQLFVYVRPSQPHTGATMSGQIPGRDAQVPGVPQPVPAQ